MENNEIVLFKNKKKEGKQPDMRGKLMIDGCEYHIAMWTREAKSSGEKFLSGKVELPKDDFASKTNAGEKTPVETKRDDDLPF